MEDRVRAIGVRRSVRGDATFVQGDLPPLRRFVEALLDPAWLTTQFHTYETWARVNSDPVLQMRLLHRPIGLNPLAAMLWATRRWETLCDRDGWFEPPMGVKRLSQVALDLAVMELHCGTFLDPPARKHLRQRLQSASGVISLVHECATLGDFIRDGVDAEPRFLKNSNPDEILLHWGGSLVPVQCKCKPPGSGRIISTEAFTCLAGMIATDAKKARLQLIVRIGSTGAIRNIDIPFLHESVLESLRHGGRRQTGRILVTHQGRTYSVAVESAEGTLKSADASKILREFGFHVGMIVGNPTASADEQELDVVVGIDAEPVERPWRSLRNSIKDATRQLEGGPPGLAAVHFTDHVPDLKPYGPDDMPIEQAMIQMMEAAPHLAAIIVSTQPDLQLPGAGSLGRGWVYFHRQRLPHGFPLLDPSS